VSRKPGPLYINPGDVAVLVYTGSVAASFEAGVIRSYIDRGFFTASFSLGIPFLSAMGGATAFQVVADLVARDAIDGGLRVEGLHAYVISTGETYWLGAGLTNADWNLVADGVIAGTHQALENPNSTAQMALFMDANYQPVFPPTSVVGPYTLYVQVTGDDVLNDGLTPATSFATIQRALQKVSALNPPESLATISVGAGVFTLPRMLAGTNVNVVGTTSLVDTLTLQSVVVANDASSIVIDVTSTGGPYLADSLRGTRLAWTSGSSNGNPGWSYRNDATVLGVTRVYATHDSGTITGITSMVPGDTISVLSLDTTLTYTGASTIKSSTQLNFYDVSITASTACVIYIVNTDKIQFYRCYFDGAGGFLRRLQVGGFGRAYLTTCYYAAASWGVDNAFLSLRNNGYIQIERGTVLDASFNTLNDTRRFVEGAAGSLMAFAKNVVCRGFDAAVSAHGMFATDGIGIFGVGGVGSDDVLFIEDANGTSTYQRGPVFKINFSGEGQGGWYQIPNLHGSILSAYSVEATNSASTLIGDGSSTITTALGVNTVSADGGISNIAQSGDLALIEGGSPPFRGFGGRYILPFTNVDLVGGVLTVVHMLGQQFVSVVVYNNSNTQVVPDGVVATSATGCTVDLTTQGALVGTWNVVVLG